MEQIEVEAYNYQTKKQNLKIQFITFTDQLKFNKSEDFYKAIKIIKLCSKSPEKIRKNKKSPRRPTSARKFNMNYRLT